MKIIIFIISSFLLFSCASSTKIILPSGESGYNISCSGTAVSISKCIEKAGEVCPSGYNVLSSHNKSWVMTNFNGQLLTTSDKGMIIQC